jgi:hypothetical protein
MAGTLTLATLSDGTNSTSSTNCIQGSAKAWVSWTGSTGATLASYNVSSVTYNTTGYWTVNMTNAMVNTNYCIMAFQGGSVSWDLRGAEDAFTRTTTAFGIASVNDGSVGTATNPPFMQVAVFSQ